MGPEKHALPNPVRNIIQDMPPPGGYPNFRIAGRYPNRGLSGPAIWAVVVGMVVFGSFNAMRLNKRRTLVREEEHSARVAVAPFLQAVEDARYVHAYKQMLERERQIMKDVPKWKLGHSTYSTTKYWANPQGEQGLVM